MKQEGRQLHRVHGAAGVVHSVSGRCGKPAGAPIPAHVSVEAAEEGGMAANPADDRGAEHGSGSAGEGVGGGGDARRLILFARTRGGPSKTKLIQLEENKVSEQIKLDHSYVRNSS